MCVSLLVLLFCRGWPCGLWWFLRANGAEDVGWDGSYGRAEGAALCLQTGERSPAGKRSPTSRLWKQPFWSGESTLKCLTRWRTKSISNEMKRKCWLLRFLFYGCCFFKQSLLPASPVNSCLSGGRLLFQIWRCLIDQQEIELLSLMWGQTQVNTRCIDCPLKLSPRATWCVTEKSKTNEAILFPGSIHLIHYSMMGF